MKKIFIDEYEVYMENGKMILGSFKDYEGNNHWFEFNEILEKEFEERRKNIFSEQYETRKHLDTSINNEYTLEIRSTFKVKSAEDTFIEKHIHEEIIKEIKTLPRLQSKRTYMRLIEGYSLTKIAQKEKLAVSSVKRSVDNGTKEIRKKLKKFLN